VDNTRSDRRTRTPFPPNPVLVADDESMLRAAVRMLLEMDGITNIVECADGDHAAREVELRPFSAVLLDLVMPGLSGVELLHHIRRSCPPTPVIVSTGLGDIETAKECLEAGAFDFLAKPVDRLGLLGSLRRAIGPRGSTQESAAGSMGGSTQESEAGRTRGSPGGGRTHES